MKATIQSNGEVTIPAAIRERLGLKAGQVLEFDEQAPFLKAVPSFDVERMRAAIGCAKGAWEGMTAEEWLNSTRGPALGKE